MQEVCLWGAPRTLETHIPKILDFPCQDASFKFEYLGVVPKNLSPDVEILFGLKLDDYAWEPIKETDTLTITRWNKTRAKNHLFEVEYLDKDSLVLQYIGYNLLE